MHFPGHDIDWIWVNGTSQPICFSSTTGTYQAGATANTTPASVLPTGWDDQTTTYSLPFNFYYNGTTYTTAGSIGIHADGWVALSTGSISMVGTGAGGSWVSNRTLPGLFIWFGQ